MAIIFLLIMFLWFPFANSERSECRHHLDCNYLLLKVVNCFTTNCTEQNRSALIHHLQANPRLYCLKSHCYCDHKAFQYDPSDNICRYRCQTDYDCQIKNQTSSNDYLASHDRLISMVCFQGLCRCPQYARQFDSDWSDRSCLEEVEVEFSNLNFVAIISVSFLFLILIILSPVVLFIQKKYQWNYHKRELEEY